ncbi:hypothetical protein NP493_335g03016 [Ridgeia piscesae]|uniref:Thioredoxin domain-containing protein n=1 Tax=Ridgeia piscesae TaxID=27915 RepID=A0AAD9NU27_RIDPI|nr:hypothetical protein NP493_335g03016 [Ridgeia piscesae]
MPVTQIDNLEALEVALNNAGDKAILIDFFATWCGPCRMIAPEVESLSEKYPNVVTLKVDVDDADVSHTSHVVSWDVAAKYGIEAMPTFLVIKNKKVVDTLQGASKPKLQEMFKKYSGVETVDGVETVGGVETVDGSAKCCWCCW